MCPMYIKTNCANLGAIQSAVRQMVPCLPNETRCCTGKHWGLTQNCTHGRWGKSNNTLFPMLGIIYKLLQSDLNIVASFDRRGEYIFTGNTKGRVMVLTCPELKMEASFKVTQGTSSATAVKSIEFARRGEWVFNFHLKRVLILIFNFQLLSCKHRWQSHQSLRQQRSHDLWRWWRTWAHTKTSRSRQQV